MRPAAILAAALALVPVAAPAAPAGSAFRCFPAPRTSFHPPTDLHGDDPRTRRYADALSWSLSHDPLHAAGATAFAVALLAEIGCGAGCILPAAIDARTGAVHWLPGSISNWPIKLLQPVAVRPDSRLVIIAGRLV